MEYCKLPPELAAPPPETGIPPEQELAAPPPEFGQSGAGPSAPGKSRRLRRLLAVPALLLTGFLCFHSVGAGALPTPSTEPPSAETTELPSSSETGSPVTESAPPTDRPEPPPEPETAGTLELLPGGDAEAEFRLVPAPGDDRVYQLRVLRMGQEVLDGQEVTGLSLLDDPASVPVTGDAEQGFTVRYFGGSAANSIPVGTLLRLYVVLVDEATGQEFEIRTNSAEPPEKPPEYQLYPLGGGTIVFTVYNDTLYFDVPSPVVVEDDYRTFLAVDSMEESGFTGYSLPAPVAPEGYEFAGWVIHVNNPMDLGSSENPFDAYSGDPPVEALMPEGSFVFSVSDVITPEDVSRVPPTDTEDGESVRFVNVHAVWLESNPTDSDIYLDDGLGHTAVYSMNAPMYSESFLYLCRYPVPERPGYVFDGWYDESGNRVDMLVSYFSFTPVLTDASGSFLGYDWNADRVPVRLYARWKES